MIRKATSYWAKKPKGLAATALPAGYLLFLQILTGIPKPDAIRERDGPKLLEAFAEELFDYPYWLQDLSHLPLFAALAWLWSWRAGGPKPGARWAASAAWVCFTYAILNELGQYYVPHRFPSAGDVIMNVAGVALGLTLHGMLVKWARGVR